MSVHELDLFGHVAMIAMSMPKDVFTEPDDDWTPIAFFECADGATAAMPLSPLMGGDIEKDVLAEVVLPAAIEHFKAKKLVLVLSVWTVENFTREEIESGNYTRPSEHPDRKEQLTLMEYSAAGVTRYSMASIIRHEDKPPTLGEWKELPEADTYEGRFVEPIVSAFKKSSPQQSGGAA